MQTFGIFAKQPIPGQVKTRLAEVLGAERAAAATEADRSERILDGAKLED